MIRILRTLRILMNAAGSVLEFSAFSVSLLAIPVGSVSLLAIPVGSVSLLVHQNKSGHCKSVRARNERGRAAMGH